MTFEDLVQQKLARLRLDAKGDVAGHAFHGNQWTAAGQALGLGKERVRAALSSLWHQVEGNVDRTRTADTHLPNVRLPHGLVSLVRHLEDQHGMLLGLHGGANHPLMRQAHQLAHSPAAHTHAWGAADHDHPKAALLTDLKLLELELKGDRPGHEFHGNQHTGAGGEGHLWATLGNRQHLEDYARNVNGREAHLRRAHGYSGRNLDLSIGYHNNLHHGADYAGDSEAAVQNRAEREEMNRDRF